MHFKEPEGLSLGPGPFVLALEAATGKTAQVGMGCRLGHAEGPHEDAGWQAWLLWLWRVCVCCRIAEFYAVREEGCISGPGRQLPSRCPAPGMCALQVVGKPEAAFFNMALADLGCSPEETVMIGAARCRKGVLAVLATGRCVLNAWDC